MMTDDSADVRWMTYDEMAEALGITPDSARRLVARRKWPRRQGNDGRARIAVPLERIPDTPPVIPADDDIDDGADEGTDAGGDVTLVVNVLTQHIERLEKELESVKSERDAERIRAAQHALLEAQHDALKSILEMERRRAGEAQQHADEIAAGLRAERDRWATQADKLLQQIEQAAEKAAAERLAKRSGWWLFRRAG